MRQRKFYSSINVVGLAVGIGFVLRDFAYRIDIGAGIFVAAGFIAIAVALVAVGYQAIMAAMANPVKNLRRE